MNINEIAKKLLELREKRMTSFIMSGELREALGFDGYGEALRRRWIMADEQGSGMVTVTNHLGTVNEIRQLAQECTCKGCGDGDCTCKCKDGKCTCKKEMESVTDDAHNLAESHSRRLSDMPSKEERKAMKDYDEEMNVNPESGMSHAPDCDCDVCEKRRKKKAAKTESVAESETAHFFAQAHAFRRHGLNQENENAEAEWQAFVPTMLAHFQSDPKIAKAAKAMGMTVEQLFKTREQALKETYYHLKHGENPPVSPEAEARFESKAIAKLTEYATMGLGRTGDAPETPVVGLGNAHSTPATTRVQPAVPAAGTASPAASPYSPGRTPQAGTLASSMVQAEAAAQKKFGRPFAELSPDQQTQVERDLQATAPPPAQ